MASRRYPDCSAALAALAEGTGGFCHDFRDIREVVLCRAWQDFRSGTAHTWSEAVEGGWQAVRGACATHGGTTPETGFLTPPPASQRVAQVRRAGMTVGVLTEEPDGTVHVCLENACHTLAGGDDAWHSVAALLETAGYQVVG